MAKEKKILILGAGLVAGPLIKYLLDVEDFRLTVTSLHIDEANKLVEGHKRGTTKELKISDKDDLRDEIKASDIVVSLLPARHHIKAAKICLEEEKHFFTTSYVKPRMKSLDSQARKKKLCFLNELGLDPGIDHMSAMRVFDNTKAAGGTIRSFKSYCGGLPAPDSDDNPWRYKFSWRPRAVLLAAKNGYRYLEDGKVLEAPGEKLFENNHVLNVEGLGDFEAYPNRDSIGYKNLYKLENVHTLFRGTLRNKGWCETWKQIHKLGLLDEEEIVLAGKTYAEFLVSLMGKSNEKHLRKVAADFCGINEKDHPLDWFEWLGLFGSDKVPLERSTPLDILADLMSRKLVYKTGEKDMTVLVHEFVIEYENRTENITSTMIDYGIPDGDSSMSRTVGLPCAIAVKLFAQDKFNVTGVKIPIDRQVYSPLLDELEKQNIKCVEKTETTYK